MKYSLTPKLNSLELHLGAEPASFNTIHISDKNSYSQTIVTNRLTESPACLVADQFDIGGNMDRILKQLGQEAPDTKPILEINPDHALVTKLAKARKKELISDLSSVLFDQALLAEGALPDDPAGFVRRINALLIK